MAIGRSDRDTSLGAWFSRPALIDTIQWTEGTQLSGAILPWYEYFNTLSVYRKIQGYSRLRAKLVIKFVINATPFQYGALLVTYKPLVNRTGDPGALDFSGGTIGSATNSQQVLMALSQRPHVMLYPQTCEGAEMELPFIYSDNWMPLEGITGFDNSLKSMGEIIYESFGVLSTASAPTLNPVTISVFAYAKDVELSGPTIQSGDEYADGGPISKPAAVISKAAGLLTSIPVIGPYMMATSVGMSYISRIARIFGYSNPPTINNVVAFTNDYLPSLADTQISTHSNKLSLDPKNELTIDPRTVGSNPGDELIISNYAKRPSYLFTSTWATSDGPSTNLAEIYITPELAHTISATGLNGGTYNVSQMTPMAHVSQMFSYWTGDIKVKFQFLCSKFHRGRVRLVFDPSGPWVVTDPVLQINEVIDLAETTTFEFTVPYMAKSLWLPTTGHPLLFANSSDLFADRGNPPFPYVTTVPGQPSIPRFNGALRLEVINELSAPLDTANVPILIFVSAADNFELAGPRSIIQESASYASPYVLQSGDEPAPTDEGGNSQRGYVSSKNTMVTMGEVAVSIRDLFHRAVCSWSTSFVCTPSTSTARMSGFNLILPRMPRFPGAYPNGYDRVDDYTTASTPYNSTSFTPLTWFIPCFTGYRGGIRWRLQPQGGTNTDEFASVGVIRHPAPYFGDGLSVIPSGFITTRAAYNQVQRGTYSGSSAMTKFMGANDVTVPMYSEHRMFPANDALHDDPYKWVYNTGLDADNILTYGTIYRPFSADGVIVDFWTSGGVDMTPFMFLNIPTIYWTAAYPTPAP